MNAAKKPVVTIRTTLRPDERTQLRKMLQDEGRTVSGITTYLLRQYMKQQQEQRA